MNDHTTHSSSADLADRLIDNWTRQVDEGFILSDPSKVGTATRHVLDPSCGVQFRFQWMPHREIRGDVAELERRGILNPNRDESKLFRDPRDPHKRHCFLCRDNIRECHPMERLLPLKLAGRDYLAGANFAWIELNHYTIMAAEHTDQAYSRHALNAMLELHQQTAGQFRVLLNGPGAGASIPWHLHYQITTTPLPIEEMTVGEEQNYPTQVYRFRADDGQLDQAHACADDWLRRDPEHHSLNLFIFSRDEATWVFVFPRDQRRATATNKGLVGGFEMAGDFVLSAPHEEEAFRHASIDISRDILSQINPENE